MKIIRCIDIETTSMKEPPESAICEIGWQDVAMEQADDGLWMPRLSEGVSMLVDPGQPIEPDARAVHHISNQDVASAPPLRELVDRVIDGADFFAAHSSAFERKYLTDLGKPWICTLKAARRIWPDAPSHSLQALRYWRDVGIDDKATWPPHRAGPDAYIGALLLIDLINSDASVRQMIAWEQQPSLLPGAIKFGKHKGVAWADAPRDYLEWIVFKSDMDEDAKFTAKHWLDAS